MLYQQVIARRYAKGLMMAAQVQDLDTIEQELSAIVASLHEKKSDLDHLFSDPAFFPSEKKAVIDEIADKYHINPVIRHFLFLLVDKSRLKLLPLIHQSFVSLLDDFHGRIRATIKSATEVDDGLVTEITGVLKKLSQKNVLTEVSVDKALLGGLRVEMGGMVIDGSVKAKLLSMKDRLVYSIESISI